MALTPVSAYGVNWLDPYYADGLAKMAPASLAPGTYARGTILGQISSTNVNDVQTVTVGATGGSYRLYLPQVGAYTAAIAYNANAATIQAAILAVIGAGNAAVTGTGPYVVTAAGAYAGQNLAVMSVDNALATGGTVSVAHTTPGVGPNGKYAAYASGNSDGSQVARGILKYPVTVDNAGNISMGTEIPGNTQLVTSMYISGSFRTEELVGLDANAVTNLGGHISVGNTTTGLLTF